MQKACENCSKCCEKCEKCIDLTKKKFLEWYSALKISQIKPWDKAKSGQFVHIEIENLDEFLTQETHRLIIADVKGLYHLISKVSNQDYYLKMMEKYESNKSKIPVFINIHLPQKSLFFLTLEN